MTGYATVGPTVLCLSKHSMREQDRFRQKGQRSEFPLRDAPRVKEDDALFGVCVHWNAFFRLAMRMPEQNDLGFPLARCAKQSARPALDTVSVSVRQKNAMPLKADGFLFGYGLGVPDAPIAVSAHADHWDAVDAIVNVPNAVPEEKDGVGLFNLARHNRLHRFSSAVRIRKNQKFHVKIPFR